MSNELTIGIDSGATTGIAVWNSQTKKYQQVVSTDFRGAVKFFQDWARHAQPPAKIIVEIPPKFVYARNDVAAGHVRDAKLKIQGGNRKEAECLADVLEVFGFEVHRVPPVKAHKWTQEELKRYTGYAARTNEHTRDAARLAFTYAGRIIK